MTPALLKRGFVDHPALGRVPYSVYQLPEDPDGQVEQTIGLMSRYAVEDSASPLIREECRMASRSGDPISDTWNFLSRKDGIRGMVFVRDEETARPWGDIGRWNPIVETLIRPCDQAVLPNPQGDCDDFAMAGAAHLLALGVPCAYCTVAADSEDPSIYSHVYLVAYPQYGAYAGKRVPMDLSHGWFAGWETENKFGKRREWPVTLNSSSNLPLCCLVAAVVAAVIVGCKW